MSLLVPFMLFGWVPLAIAMFLNLKPHHAVLCIIIGGWLFLPMTTYNLPGIPPYSKNTAIAIGLIIGGWFSRRGQASLFQWRAYDLPMVIYCLTPVATSLSNDLGLYNGISGAFYQFVVWGVPYLAGRTYFRDIENLRDLCIGIIIGGLLYAPLCLYEVRMSPQLSNIFFGFFPHSFVQHMRYDGFRPIVFMQHGLMVALWMALTSTVAYWFWRERKIERMNVLFVVILVGVTIICKSVNGWFSLLAGICFYSIFKRYRSNFLFFLLLIMIPLYISVRATDFISADTVKTVAKTFVDEERVASLGVRLTQENLFSQKAWERPLLGWGGYLRGWPVDPDTEEKLIKMIDSTWLITFNTYGLVGLVSLFVAMLQGPWRTLSLTSHRLNDGAAMVPILLSLIIVLFMIDALFNGMVNPIIILSSGAVMSWYLKMKEDLSKKLLLDVNPAVCLSRGRGSKNKKKSVLDQDR